MTISYRTPTVVRDASNTTVSVAKPTGTAAGDLLRVILAASTARTWNVPAGWAVIPGTAATDRCVTLYRVADGSEGSTFTFTQAGAATALAVGCVATIGTDSGNPFNVADFDQALVTNIVSSGPITVTTGTVLDSMCLMFSLNTVVTAPGSMTQDFQANTGFTFALAHQAVSPGSTGGKNWSWTGNQSAAMSLCALNPANDIAVTAVKATATATAKNPVASTIAPVNPPAATATAAAKIPVVSAVSNPIVVAIRATATATAPAPAVSAVRAPTVAPPIAVATAQALVPDVVVLPERNVTLSARVNELSWTAEMVPQYRYRASLANPPWTADLETP